MAPSGPTASRRRRRPERVVAFLAALVVLLQLPGPGTCRKRFAAASQTVPDAESDPRSADVPADAGLALTGRIEVPKLARAWFVLDVASPSRLDIVIDAGTTRAPPPA